MAVEEYSDEKWIVQKSLSLLKTDICEAKSWLLTARTLFPKTFQIQYQTYRLEKMQKNHKKVALLLEDMLANFPQESALWEEISQLTEVLQIDVQDEKSHFLKEVFNALPPRLQCSILLKVADTHSDVLQQCRLIMLVLQRYPEEVQNHGIKLAESLIEAEKVHQMSSPVNCYRKYLVCNLLPLVLKASLSTSCRPLLLNWLQKAMEFYITYITQPPTPDMLMSPPPLVVPQSVSSRRASVQEKEYYISNPWDRMLELLCLTSKHLGWNLHNYFCTTNLEYTWQQLLSQYDHLTSPVDPQHLSQVFYGSTALCLYCIVNYMGKVEPDSFTGHGGGSSSTVPLILINAVVPSQNTPSEHKKAKVEASSPQLTAGREVTSYKEIFQNLKVAVKCWELLQSNDVLCTELHQLIEQWHAEQWIWLQNFKIDYCLYQGHFKEAVSLLQKVTLTRGSCHQIKNELQLANCFYCMNNLSKACECILRVVQSVPQTSDKPSDPPPQQSSRQLHLMTCNGADVFAFCIHLLLACLKEKAFKSYQGSDLALGHTVVLLQHHWPHYEPVFQTVYERIKKRGTFSYGLFFNYVINIDILEEIAYLKSVNGGKLNLDILPASTKATGTSRTVTRGVNKGVKEDFKLAMEKQVGRSLENVDSLLCHFLSAEKTLIQQSLM